MRVRISPVSLAEEPNRDYVLTMNLVCAAAAGVASALYLRAGWWGLAIGLGLAGGLELGLRWRYTAWLAILVGTIFSAGAGAIGVMAIATQTTNVRTIWWIAAGIGAIVGAALMLDAHRKLRKARHTA
jgi:hypothetical protein